MSGPCLRLSNNPIEIIKYAREVEDFFCVKKKCQRHQRLGTRGLPATPYSPKAPVTKPKKKRKTCRCVKKQTLQYAYCLYIRATTFTITEIGQGF